MNCWIMKEQRTIDVDHLVVDEENPRFEAVSTEEDALFSILEDQALSSGNKILNLARDIAEHGLNASELLIVSPIDGTDTYLVREGNRRVTAIKLSLHSNRIPTRFIDLSPQFAKLSETMQKHRLIECCVCDDEDEIRRLLSLRHGGERGGVGTVKWNAAQTARFSQKGNPQSARALSLVEHLCKTRGYDAITTVAANIPATNLGRLLSTPEIRQILNITVNGNEARYLGGHDDLLLDVFSAVKDNGVGPIYNKEDRIRLVEEAAGRIEPHNQKQTQLPFSKPALSANNETAPGCVTQTSTTNKESYGNVGRQGGFSESSPHISEVSRACEDTPFSQQPNPINSNNGSVGGNQADGATSGGVRRKPVRLGSSKRMFGQTLRPKGVESNNIYRGIDWIDEQYLKNPDGLAHLLPILGFSLRLLMETVAREYFASIGEDYGDRSLSKFVKDIVKPTITAKLDTTERNSLVLASEWINGINTFEALLSKWAHGTLAVDRASLVQQSELAALIIDVLWT